MPDPVPRSRASSTGRRTTRSASERDDPVTPTTTSGARSADTSVIRSNATRNSPAGAIATRARTWPSAMLTNPTSTARSTVRGASAATASSTGTATAARKSLVSVDSGLPGGNNRSTIGTWLGRGVNPTPLVSIASPTASAVKPAARRAARSCTTAPGSATGGRTAAGRGTPVTVPPAAPGHPAGRRTSGRPNPRPQKGAVRPVSRGAADRPRVGNQDGLPQIAAMRTTRHAQWDSKNKHAITVRRSVNSRRGTEDANVGHVPVDATLREPLSGGVLWDTVSNSRRLTSSVLAGGPPSGTGFVAEEASQPLALLLARPP